MNRKIILKILSIVTIIGILFTLYLTNENVILSAIRTLTNKPHEVAITNVTPNSVTISWFTKFKDKGYVYYKEKGSQDSETIVSDDRLTTVEVFGNDISGKFYTHHVTISGLTPNTQYDFSLSNGFRNWNYNEVVSVSDVTKKYVADNNSKDFIFVTSQTTNTLVNPAPLMGLNIIEDGSGEFYKYATDSIVYIQDKNGNVLSAPADSLGYWIVDVSPIIPPEGKTASSREIEDSPSLTNLTVKFQNENLAKPKITELTYGDYSDKRLDLKIQIAGIGENNSRKVDFVSDAEATEINCNQDRPDKSVSGVVSKSEFKTLANNWVSGRGKNYVDECYNDVVCTSMENGINVGFALWVWLHESAGSNYTAFNQEIEDFGIHSGGIPGNNFKKQIDYFVSLSHGNPCPDLDYWTGWATNYLNGSCDITEKNFLTGQTGPEYLDELKNTYSWVSSNGLPSKIKGSPNKSACSGGGGGSCQESCNRDDGLLISCTPPDANGDENISSCNTAGRVEGCGGIDYCCPEAGGQWTKDMTACPDSGGSDPDVEVFSVKFTPTVSLISFPMDPVNKDGKDLTVSEFMELYSSGDDDKIDYIARYVNGKWQVYKYDDVAKVGVGNDFSFDINEGYFVKLEDDVKDPFTLDMEGLVGDVKYNFVEGWNLIGMGYGVDQKVKDFIGDNSGLSAVSYWNSEYGLYTGVVLANDEIYGQEFNVRSGKGYFARLSASDGGGDGDGDSGSPYEVKGRCCRLKISNGKDKLDWEDEIPPCEVAWELGRNIYGGTLESVTEVEGKTKTSCE